MVITSICINKLVISIIVYIGGPAGSVLADRS